jgi:molecular chaperone DnaK (HSP70)
LIGRRFEDSTVQADMKHWPFEVISDGGKPKIKISYKGENKIFSPEEVLLTFIIIFYSFNTFAVYNANWRQ